MQMEANYNSIVPNSSLLLYSFYKQMPRVNNTYYHEKITAYCFVCRHAQHGSGELQQPSHDEKEAIKAEFAKRGPKGPKCGKKGHRRPGCCGNKCAK